MFVFLSRESAIRQQTSLISAAVRMAAVVFCLLFSDSARAQGLRVEMEDGTVLMSDDQIDFGDVAWKQDSAAVSVVIRNLTAMTLTGLNVEITGAGGTHFRLGTEAGTALPAETTTVSEVRFHPLGIGQKKARLRVNWDGNPGPAIETGLVGSGWHRDDSLNVSVLGGEPGRVRSVMAMEGGDLLVAGGFTQVDSHAVSKLSWFDSVGSINPTLLRLTATYQTNFNFGISALSVRSGFGAVLAGFSQSLFMSPEQAGWHMARTKTLAGGPLGGVSSWSSFGDIPNHEVLAMASDVSGRLYYGGRFTSLSLLNQSRLARALPVSGLTDHSFGLPFDGDVVTLCGQADGGMLVGGVFTSPRPNLLRLNEVGEVDTSFQPHLNGGVTALLELPSGDVLVAGDFTVINGAARSWLAKIRADGSLDSTYSPVLNGSVLTMALQADGCLLVGGNFTLVNGVARSRLARILVNGELDMSFEAGADGVVWSVSLQPDGAILVGGDFSMLGGVQRSGLARLPNDPGSYRSPPVIESDGTIVWPCSGGVPELFTVGFQKFTLGAGWTSLDKPVRTQRGWELSGPDLEGASSVRVRGLNRGGLRVASEVSVESYVAVPTGPGFSQLVVEDAQGRTLHPVTGVLDFEELIRPDTMVTSKRLRLRNLGTADFAVPSVFISGAPSEFTHNFSGPQVIPPGGMIEFDVIFTPRQLGRRNADLTISSSTTGYFPVIALAGMVSDRLSPLIGSASMYTSEQVNALLETVDGRIWIGGDFGGNPNKLARYHSDGTIDANPAVTAPSGTVECFATLPDGSFLYGESMSSRLIKLTPTRERDFLFSPHINGKVSAIEPLADGRMLIGGEFTTINGEGQRGVALLKQDGTLDGAFKPVLTGGFVTSVLRQPDGKVLVAGSFTEVNGAPHARLVRLNPDGTTDASFSAQTDAMVRVIVLDRLNRVLIGGAFGSVNGEAQSYLARLHTNGVLDVGFAPVFNDIVNSIVVQENGELLIGGDFTQVDGLFFGRVVRLSENGRRVSGQTFGSVNASVTALALQRDGQILVGGRFTTFGSISRRRFVRLPAPVVAVSELEKTGTNTVLWRRGGGAGALSNVTIEVWGGGRWESVGLPVRTEEGWSVAGKILPGDGLVRARGWRRGSLGAGSAQFEEQILVLGSPVFPQVRVELVHGAAVPGISVLSFGSTPFPEQVSRQFLVKNTGTVPLRHVKAVLRGSGATEFRCSALPNVLAPGRAAVCTVTFRPKNKGSASAMLIIESNAVPHDTWALNLLASSFALPEMVAESREGGRAEHGQTLRVGGLLLNGAVSGTLVLRNTGNETLSIGTIGIEGDDAASFQVGNPVSRTVAPGKFTSLPVTLNPVRGGEHQATLSVGTNIPGKNPYVLHLRMFRAIKARILTQPQGRLLAVGEDLNLSIEVEGIPAPKIQWLKDGKAIKAAASPDLYLHNAGLSAGGIYTCRVTNVVEGKKAEVTSHSVKVGVFDTTNGEIVAEKGKRAVLAARVSGPVELGWVKDDSIFLLSPGQSLNFPSADDADEGEYMYEVSMAGHGTRNGGRLRLKLFDKSPALLRPVELGAAPVLGAWYESQVRVDEVGKGAPTRYEARGLPPGLKINPQTGRIHGVATASRPEGYRVELTVKNALGVDRETVTLHVTGLPDDLAGSYEGLVGRMAGSLGGLGGRMAFKVAGNAGISGRITLGGTHLAFRGSVEIHPTGDFPPTARVTVHRKSAAPLSLVVEFGPTRNRAAYASLSEGSEVVAITVWRNRWGVAQPADAFAGYHTFTFGGSPGGELPEGFGAGSLTLKATGQARIAAWAPDGAAFTCAWTLGPEGEVGIYSTLYLARARGSILGMLLLSGQGGPGSKENMISGVLDQLRPPSSGRLFPGGFGSVLWPVEGAGYEANLRPFEVAARDDEGLEILFSGAGIQGLTLPPDVSLRVQTNGRFSPLPDYDGRTVVSIFPKTGLFSGTFESPDINPLTGGVVTRRAPFRGVICWDGSHWIGKGFHLLPTLPSLDTTSIFSRTPIWGGRVEMR